MSTPSVCNVSRFAPSLEALDDELGRVHERAFARLLLAAGRLRARAQRGRPVGPRRLAAWRRAARRAQELAIIDGYELPGRLRRCLAHDPQRWGSARELVQAAWGASACEVRRRAARLCQWIPEFPVARHAAADEEGERW